ncbi:MAG: DUF2283 domain-containing protein [Patescibacteria group bacterium]
MKITYDKEADAAMIYLQEIKQGGTAWTYPCDPTEIKGMINLDFDKDNRLIGIEVLDASKRLPKELLDSAERIDKSG